MEMSKMVFDILDSIERNQIVYVDTAPKVRDSHIITSPDYNESQYLQ